MLHHVVGREFSEWLVIPEMIHPYYAPPISVSRNVVIHAAPLKRPSDAKVHVGG
jgi:hypothetical protein